jgi:hypothetical protein
MSQLYLVVRSGYDYVVECAFSTEEGAENYLKGFDRLRINHGFRIEYGELDPEVPSVEKAVEDKIDAGLHAYMVWVQQQGIPVEEKETFYSIEDLLEYSDSYVGGPRGNLVVKVLANSEEEARELAKNAHECFVAECKANGWYHG